jgi:Methyltransferase domain
MLEYSVFRDRLKWRTEGDPLIRDGMDHYQMDSARFERAVKVLGPLSGATICDLGSFPGYGLWAFRECGRYIGMGKCPEWYRDALVSEFNADWLECDFENDGSLPVPAQKPNAVILQEVIEHVRKPKAFLTSIYKWMPAGAKLYVTTNNIHYVGYILKLFAGKEIFHSAISEDTVYPGHCTYYSLAGLSSLLEDLGFKVTSASRLNFLPESRFYRRRQFALVKNSLTNAVPRRYASHLEILCEKR